MAIDKAGIAARVVQDIPDGAYVNLGIGIPTLVARYVDPDKEIIFHSENGILGSGGHVEPGQEDPDYVDAGKAFIKLVPGASLFDSSASFGMMRSGALDIAVLGGFQVSAAGDLANWTTGAEGSVPSVGGAMDLASRAKSVFVTMTLFDKNGDSKLVPECTYPLTARQCVDRLYTDHAVFEFDARGPRIVETAPGVTEAELREWTGIDFV